MTKVRVGIILDSLSSSKQIFDFIKMSAKSTNYEITHLIIQRNKLSTKNSIINKLEDYLKKKGLKKLLYALSFKILLKIEEIFLKRFKKYSDFFNNYSLDKFNLEQVVVEPKISKNGNIYRYSDEDLKKIKSLNLNLLIRGGSGILKGEVLKICKNGIISFHHGDNDYYRGGPPGFWEIKNKDVKTGFIIQKLSEELDNGEVLFKGFFLTHWIYTVNLINLLEKSNEFLYRVINDITSENPKKSFVTEKSQAPIYTLPSTYVQLCYFFSVIKKISKKTFNKIFKIRQSWNIAYQFTNEWKNINFNKFIKISNPPGRYLADPFLIKKNKDHYCFVEDYSSKINKGCISVYKINENSCEEVGIALKEDFHLSYPFVFSHKDELYMCPETHEAKEIRLYKCIEFPLKWKYLKTLIPNVSAVDTNIFFKDNRWWLMTNLSNCSLEDHASQLHIFSCEELISDNWKPHKKNPIIFNPINARNGGLISETNDFYRVHQKPGFDNYGESLSVSKINELNDENYSEINELKILPNFFKDINGTHTLNFKDGLLVLDFSKTSKD